MRLAFLSIVSGSVFGLCVSIAPIPRGTQGQGFPYSRSACDAKVEIDVFLDLTCPDSKAAFPVLKQVADHFGDQVALQSYMFPLPYHRASYLACRGTFAVDGFNNNLTYQWMKTVFDNQGTLYNSRTANIGDDQVSAIPIQITIILYFVVQENVWHSFLFILVPNLGGLDQK